jgi:sec-independent protein translocase protein TatB
MFGIGTTELVVILIVALLVLGPKKLPEIARSLGKTLGEFRRVTTDVKRTIEMEADQEEEIRAKKRIRREMAQKASKESPSPEQDEKDPYLEEKIASESAQTEPESDKKNTAT